MTLNAAGREIPSNIPGYGSTEGKLFKGAWGREPEQRRVGARIRSARPSQSKLLKTIKDAISATGLKSGMTISFHHHLRNGDHIVCSVIDACAEMGIRDLTIFPTALFSVHEGLVEHIKSGVIRTIMGSVNGPIGMLVSKGGMNNPVVLRSHGGRPRAVASGDVHIDVAFIGAPSADLSGNASGRFGKSACGALGYADTDATYADQVVVITDSLVPFPLSPASVPGDRVDYVVEIESIGDPEGIVSGTTRLTRDPLRLMIAQYASRLIESSPYFKDGISFQTGAGGISLAVTAYLREAMRDRGITASFGLGGITGYFVQMLREGLIKKLLDVQSFDLEAVKSIASDPRHVEITAGQYADPWTCGAVVNSVDAVILGATEVDVNFNANVNTEFNGALLHGIGGHQDTAAGSKLTIIAMPLMRKRIPCVTNRVHAITTPGECIDAIVTEYGVAINPRRKDLIDACVSDLKGGKNPVPIVTIDELHDRAARFAGRIEPLHQGDQIVGVIEWRDGSVLDTIRSMA